MPVRGYAVHLHTREPRLFRGRTVSAGNIIPVRTANLVMDRKISRGSPFDPTEMVMEGLSLVL